MHFYYEIAKEEGFARPLVHKKQIIQRDIRKKTPLDISTVHLIMISLLLVAVVVQQGSLEMLQ
jgi:hypothetical protein